jgi:uncharacterized protein YbaR (Trm112 family)/SAM-dependent methyltransferase
MNPELLELLACPGCGGALAESDLTLARGRIVSGRLHCPACEATYPIFRGIPRLQPAGEVPDEAARTARHFERELPLGSPPHHSASPHALRSFEFFSRTGVDPELYQRKIPDFYPTEAPDPEYEPDGSFLHGKRVLDGGCGAGRFLPIAAEHAERVIGLELGDHIDHAAEYCEGLENVDLVQGSVLAPPFRPGIVDFVYTVGVLHHTQDPGGAALALAKLVSVGGAMSIWVYPPEYWGNAIRSRLGPRLHRYLAAKEPDEAERFVRRWLLPLGKAQEALARRRVTKYVAAPVFIVGVPRRPDRDEMVATILDYYASPIIHTHSSDEVRSWLEGAGFSDLTALPVPVSWIADRKSSATD